MECFITMVVLENQMEKVSSAGGEVVVLVDKGQFFLQLL